MWIIFALLAALASALVVMLSKSSMKGTPPSLVFAIQAVLVLAVAWGTVLGQGLLPALGKVGRRDWLVLAAAGVLTAASSLLSFKALSLGSASRVSPLTSGVTLLFSIALAAVFLREKLTWPILLGAALMAGGALVIAFAPPAGK